VTSEPHVSDIELLAFAAGTRDEKKQFEIADHVRGCARCRAFVRAMEHVGGTILESLAPTSLAAGSFAAVMAQRDQASNVTDDRSGSKTA
jgi:putative transcriptional regulator